MATDIWIPIGISACAVIIAFIAFWRAKVPATLKSSEPDFQAFKILGDEKVKTAKDDLTKEWCDKKNNGKIIFNGDLKWQVRKVRDAYENVSSLYQLGLLNKDSFRHVYGNLVVSTYRLMKDEIENMRSMSNNPNICKNFEDTAVDFITQYNINAEPFCPPSPSHSTITTASVTATSTKENESGGDGDENTTVSSNDISESIKLTEKNRL